jgi:hypothetical protein
LDESGIVDPEALKQQRDGERFVIVLQPKDAEEDIEEIQDPADPGSPPDSFK